MELSIENNGSTSAINSVPVLSCENVQESASSKRKTSNKDKNQRKQVTQVTPVLFLAGITWTRSRSRYPFKTLGILKGYLENKWKSRVSFKTSIMFQDTLSRRQIGFSRYPIKIPYQDTLQDVVKIKTRHLQETRSVFKTLWRIFKIHEKCLENQIKRLDKVSWKHYKRLDSPKNKRLERASWKKK